MSSRDADVVTLWTCPECDLVWRDEQMDCPICEAATPADALAIALKVARRTADQFVRMLELGAPGIIQQNQMRVLRRDVDRVGQLFEKTDGAR